MSARNSPTLLPEESDATLLGQERLVTGKACAASQPPTVTCPTMRAVGIEDVAGVTDASEVRIFLDALFARKPDDLHLLLWTLPEKRSHWFQNAESAIQFTESLRERDLYVGVGLSGRDYGPTRRCPSNEVAGIVGVWADLDVKSHAHPNPALPATIEDAMKILPEQLPPTFVILTGNGVQAWWLFHEPLIFNSDEDRRDAADLSLRWQSLLRRNAAALGWSFDRLADLARVLRIPGTQNCKDPSNPKPVVIQSQGRRRYDPSELADYLDSVAVAEPGAHIAPDQEWAQSFRDKPLIIDLSARIPEDRINGWLVANLRFKNTWYRQRSDLHDQSQSGYDLALACFGSSIGLTEQEIVDLIVHHRALHKQKQRTALDYFHRTISKAASRADSEIPDPANSGSSENGQNPTSPPEPDKAAICRNLSEVLGAQIDRLTKISGRSPIFQMDLAEGKAEFPNVGKLISQTCVRNTLAGITGKLMRLFKPKQWEKIAQALLDACVVEEGGEEMDMEGSARLHLCQYLSAAIPIDSLDGESRELARRPLIADGFITVCASDIQTFINKTTTENVTIPAVVGMLSAVGAKSRRFRGKFPEQSRWLLPPDKFSPADYAVNPGQEQTDDSQ